MSTTATTITLDFAPFKAAIAKQFERMKQHPLFRTATTKDQIWATYLGSFPEGTNPVYKERTEHDCNCCKSFIRAVGNMVAVIDGQIVSLWDIQIDGPYQVVADALAAYVKAQPIENTFLHTERVAGVDKNFQDLLGEVKTWQHFFINLPHPQLVSHKDHIGTALSKARSTHDVMLRALTELTPGALNEVLELIAQNSLYRGQEHKFVVETFQKLKHEFDQKTDDLSRDLFVWSRVKSVPDAVAHIRNSAIGTLLVALSEGTELDEAVRAFERVVAPANYKRPTALVTPRMLEQAKNTITELGLMSALERRYATIQDITINNILHANRDAKKALTGNVFDDLAASMPTKPKSLDKVEEVTIDKFLADILPKAESIEVLVENRLASNLVSLVAPVDPTAGRLFKWDNGFSWSYNGDLADSIKERVKKAGGNVTGDLCCRLAWFNTDDLDFHMKEPRGGHIYFREKRSHATGGQLDVDMNAGNIVRDPVENIFYGDKNRMAEGVYTLQVHQFAQRETKDVGFEVEIDFMGTVYRFAYDKAVHGIITVAEFEYTHAGGLKLLKSLPESTVSKTVWNIPTETFHKVNVMMLSPNHWDGQVGVGNKHYFFMLEGCLNDGQARGFFNEFLRADLDTHRKAFEMVGAKMRTEESGNQLSGLGFSSTQRNHVIVRVKGAFTRDLKVTF